jgi:hypothetical protein
MSSPFAQHIMTAYSASSRAAALVRRRRRSGPAGLHASWMQQGAPNWRDAPFHMPFTLISDRSACMNSRGVALSRIVPDPAQTHAQAQGAHVFEIVGGEAHVQVHDTKELRQAFAQAAGLPAGPPEALDVLRPCLLSRHFNVMCQSLGLIEPAGE